MSPREIMPTGSMAWNRHFERGLWFVILVLLSCLFVLPFCITVSDSLKSFLELYAQPRVWFPDPPRFDNFVEIFRILPFHRFFINTFLIVCLQLLGQISSACVVGYSFARLKWPFRDYFFILLLSTIMLPPQVTMIPVFLLFNELGWVGTWLPLIVPAYFGGGVFNIFLLRQFFKTIPTALEDAAKIDGCSTPRILTTIMIPLAKPAVATICVLSFISHWNDFMGPLIYLSGGDYTLYPISLGIWMFKSAQEVFPQYIMAASLVSLLPTLTIFFSAQQYFVKGIVMHGIKG
jgi:multiple sugar transport system permease protein